MRTLQHAPRALSPQRPQPPTIVLVFNCSVLHYMDFRRDGKQLPPTFGLCCFANCSHSHEPDRAIRKATDANRSTIGAYVVSANHGTLDQHRCGKCRCSIIEPVFSYSRVSDKARETGGFFVMYFGKLNSSVSPELPRGNCNELAQNHSTQQICQRQQKQHKQSEIQSTHTRPTAALCIKSVSVLLPMPSSERNTGCGPSTIV